LAHTETIKQAHARIAAALDMEMDKSGITAMYPGCASSHGLAYIVLDVVRTGQDIEQWTIRADVNVPAGNHGPAMLAKRLGELAQLSHVQACAMAMVGGRTWNMIE